MPEEGGLAMGAGTHRRFRPRDPDCGMTETLHISARAASDRSPSVDVLTRKLLGYFAALGAPKGHVFEVRDINLQVMMNVYAPAERALLEVVIEGLVQRGALRRVSATGYSLTDDGLARVRRLRYPGDAGLHGVGESLPRSGPAAQPSA